MLGTPGVVLGTPGGAMTCNELKELSLPLVWPVVIVVSVQVWVPVMP